MRATFNFDRLVFNPEALDAKSLTSLGTVSAIRESSVIIAAMIGVVFFGERPWRLRLVAALIVAVGVIVMAGTA